MTTVITYGTYDLLHEGHIRLLERAKSLGDRLIVGVTSDTYDAQRGKLNVNDSLLTRIANVRSTGIADEIIVEEYEGQKIRDVEQYDVDIFAIGSDWQGKFDYLRDYCDVVYLERTAGVSSTKLRNSMNGLLRFGVIGAGRMGARFVRESRNVSGIYIAGAYDVDPAASASLVENLEAGESYADIAQLLADTDAVYIATPHETHVELTWAALNAGKHVLCETPLTLDAASASELYALAKSRGLVLLEAAKTAFLPGFRRMLELVKSGKIGTIRSVDARLTKLVDSEREFQAPYGGALSEMGTYPFLSIVKILGAEPDTIQTRSFRESNDGVDYFSRVNLEYPHATASITVAIGVKSEGSLVVSGSKGYVYVPAPWWLTDSFEIRYEDTRMNRWHFYPYEGDGLRYEIAEFGKMINARVQENYKWRPGESIAVARMIEESRRRTN